MRCWMRFLDSPYEGGRVAAARTRFEIRDFWRSLKGESQGISISVRLAFLIVANKAGRDRRRSLSVQAGWRKEEAGRKAV